MRMTSEVVENTGESSFGEGQVFIYLPEDLDGRLPHSEIS